MLITFDGIAGSGKSTLIGHINRDKQIHYVNAKPHFDPHLRHCRRDREPSRALTCLSHLTVTLAEFSRYTNYITDHFWEPFFTLFVNDFDELDRHDSFPCLLRIWESTATQLDLPVPTHSFFLNTEPGVADRRRVYRDHSISLAEDAPNNATAQYYRLFLEFSEFMAKTFEFCHTIDANRSAEEIANHVQTIISN